LGPRWFAETVRPLVGLSSCLLGLRAHSAGWGPRPRWHPDQAVGAGRDLLGAGPSHRLLARCARDSVTWGPRAGTVRWAPRIDLTSEDLTQRGAPLIHGHGAQDELKRRAAPVTVRGVEGMHPEGRPRTHTRSLARRSAPRSSPMSPSPLHALGSLSPADRMNSSAGSALSLGACLRSAATLLPSHGTPRIEKTVEGSLRS